jgi:CheY-like chemotaxis protein
MKKILLASSKDDFLRRNTNLLMSWSFKLFTATRGKEILDLNKEHDFDLILSDSELEDMSGSEFCSLIRHDESSRNVPVILTCHNIPGIIESFEQSGANAIILKPIDPIQLLENIGKYIGIRLVRDKRVAFKHDVTCEINGLKFVCSSHDISISGIFLETDSKLDLGSRITCRFTLPDSCNIELSGEAIRCISSLNGYYRYGVKFISVPSTCQKALGNFIASASNIQTATQNTKAVDYIRDSKMTP